MPLGDLSRVIIEAGIGMIIIGVLIWAAGNIPVLKDIPGMIRLQLDGLTCIIPILASILISLVLTIMLNIIGRIIGR